MVPDDHPSGIISGLTPLASSTYETLLRSPTGACDSNEVQAAISLELVRRGFAVVVPGPPRLLVPIPPEIAIGRATVTALHDWMASAPDLDAVERELRRLGTTAPPLLGQMGGSGRNHQFAVVADDQSRAVYAEARNDARRIMRTMQPYPTWHNDDYVEDPSTTTYVPDDGLAKGVKHQFLYDDKILAIPWFLKEALDEVQHGTEARVAQSPLPTQMTLIDGRCAMVACDPHQPVMLYTTAPLLVAALEMLFDVCWDRAVVLRADQPDDAASGVEETDRAVLRLLVQGEKNDRIARALGISPRTVSRAIRRLQSAYAVPTRAALVAVVVQQNPRADNG